MKKLLHLYNYGHNPFPQIKQIGRGGLGYHLPQYRKRSLHGEGGKKGITQKEAEDEGINEYLKNLINEMEEINEMEKIGHKITTPDKDDIQQDIQNIIDISSGITESKIKPKKSKGTEDFESDISTTESKPKSKPKSKPIINIKEESESEESESEEEDIIKPLKVSAVDPDKYGDQKETDIIEIQNYLRNRFPDTKRGKFEGNPKYLAYYDIIIQENPNITFEQFKHIEDMQSKDPEKLKKDGLKSYTQYAYEYIETEKKGQKSMNKLNKEVAKLQKEKLAENPEETKQTITKGHTFEDVLLSEQYQPMLKDITGSQTNFVSSNNNTTYYNNDDLSDPIMVNAGIRGLVPLASCALYDANSTDTTIDFKNYGNTNIVDIQFSKFCGSFSFKPLFRKDSETNKIKLYNILYGDDEFVNDNDNTDAFIVAKVSKNRKTQIGSFDVCNFIDKNIQENEKIYKTIEGVKCFIPKESFMRRMIKEGKIRESNHGDKWFSVHIGEMNKYVKK
jgi:hypothetical protein